MSAPAVRWSSLLADSDTNLDRRRAELEAVPQEFQIAKVVGGRRRVANSVRVALAPATLHAVEDAGPTRHG